LLAFAVSPALHVADAVGVLAGRAGRRWQTGQWHVAKQTNTRAQANVTSSNHPSGLLWQKQRLESGVS